MVGIYKIENLINHKIYIGQSSNIERRWSEHKCRYNNENNNCYNLPLYNSIRKNGLENFSFEVVCECSIEELNTKEKEFIEKYDSLLPKGYNLKLDDFLGDRKQYSCLECGIRIGKNKTKLCQKCYTKSRKKDRPEPLELARLIKEHGFEKTGIIFGITGNGIKKWCQDYQIPSHKQEIINWYDTEMGIEKQVKKQWKKMVAQIDIETEEIINIFESAAAAGRSIGKLNNHIVSVCNGKLKTAYGYVWKYI